VFVGGAFWNGLYPPVMRQVLTVVDSYDGVAVTDVERDEHCWSPGGLPGGNSVRERK